MFLLMFSVRMQGAFLSTKYAFTFWKCKCWWMIPQTDVSFSLWMFTVRWAPSHFSWNRHLQMWNFVSISFSFHSTAHKTTNPGLAWTSLVFCFVFLSFQIVVMAFHCFSKTTKTSVVLLSNILHPNAQGLTENGAKRGKNNLETIL